MTWDRLWRAVVLAAMLAILRTTPALPHDWYGPYKTPAGSSCCGGQDCHRLDKGDVRPVASGYAVKLGAAEIVVPFGRVTASEDEDFHICIWGGAIQCFFAPPLGT